MEVQARDLSIGYDRSTLCEWLLTHSMVVNGRAIGWFLLPTAINWSTDRNTGNKWIQPVGGKAGSMQSAGAECDQTIFFFVVGVYYIAGRHRVDDMNVKSAKSLIGGGGEKFVGGRKQEKKSLACSFS